MPRFGPTNSKKVVDKITNDTKRITQKRATTKRLSSALREAFASAYVDVFGMNFEFIGKNIYSTKDKITGDVATHRAPADSERLKAHYQPLKKRFNATFQEMEEYYYSRISLYASLKVKKTERKIILHALNNAKAYVYFEKLRVRRASERYKKVSSIKPEKEIDTKTDDEFGFGFESL